MQQLYNVQPTNAEQQFDFAPRLVILSKLAKLMVPLYMNVTMYCRAKNLKLIPSCASHHDARDLVQVLHHQCVLCIRQEPLAPFSRAVRGQ